MKIKSNENLFQEWQTLSDTMKLLAGIVQNDQTISDKQWIWWNRKAIQAQKRLDSVKLRTQRYINT